MATDPDPLNTLTPAGRSSNPEVSGVPETIRRRYYLDERGGAGTGFYVDAQVKMPAFRDRGRTLAADRADPNAIRDMAAIASHRGWTIVMVRGSREFRREAWLAGRAIGLEVRGYRPSERDLQELARRNERTQRSDRQREPAVREGRSSRQSAREDLGARSRLAVVERVVRTRIADEAAQDRILATARSRLAHWLEQGARFEPLRARAQDAEVEATRRRERQR